MVKLVIQQYPSEIELEFKDTVEASVTIEHLIPFAKKETLFTLTSEVKGEEDDN
jgi:hypothetical protein